MSNARELPSKEASLFRQVAKHYEQKQYKKGLKTADGVLKKFPNHGETLAMKGLLLNCLERKEEAYDLVKKGVKNDLTSPVCWHVYGLVYRSDKNYEEASKCYLNALKFDKENQQILRDLGVLQMHMRNYNGYKETRRQLLVQKPTVRQNWTALAIANHLLEQYGAAEKMLTSYEDTLKSPPSRSDVEHSEALLYKVMIIQESGDGKRALEELEKIKDAVLDRQAYLEMRARILLEIGDARAPEAYKRLLDRNSDEHSYFVGYERSLGIRDDDGVIVDGDKYATVSDELARAYPRSDAARRLPLDYFSGDEFRKRAVPYLQYLLRKGVPSTFANIRTLYLNPDKASVIHSIVFDHLKELEGGEEKANGQTQSSLITTLSVLAQHYDYVRATERAIEYIDRAIALSEDVELLITKARIYKHAGDPRTASRMLESARVADLKDRFVNTKSSKYLLRNGLVDEAVKVMGLFTRNEAKGGPVGDLHEMQCHWFLLESAHAYYRRGQPWLALKRLHAVKKIFDEWWEDQHDFHTYSLRKGAVRAYIEMLRWENQLRSQPYYASAAELAASIYIDLYEHHGMAYDAYGADYNTLDDGEKKRFIKKHKKKNTEKAGEDADPDGFLLAQTSTPLEDADQFVRPLRACSPSHLLPHRLTFEIEIRRGDLRAALRALQLGYRIAPHDPDVHRQVVRLKLALRGDDHGAQRTELETIAPLHTSAAELNESYLSQNPSPACQLAGLEMRVYIDGSLQAKTESALLELLPCLTLPQAENVLQLLGRWNSGARQDFRDAARKRFPYAVIFT